LISRVWKKLIFLHAKLSYKKKLAIYLSIYIERIKTSDLENIKLKTSHKLLIKIKKMYQPNSFNSNYTSIPNQMQYHPTPMTQQINTNHIIQTHPLNNMTNTFQNQIQSNYNYLQQNNQANSYSNSFQNPPNGNFFAQECHPLYTNQVHQHQVNNNNQQYSNVQMPLCSNINNQPNSDNNSVQNNLDSNNNQQQEPPTQNDSVNNSFQNILIG